MIAPLPFDFANGTQPSLAGALGVGIAFGWCLERAGLGSAPKLMGQFTLRDMTVLKVMFSAIVTAMLGLFWLARFGIVDLSRVYVPETFVLPQIVGGLVLGVIQQFVGTYFSTAAQFSVALLVVFLVLVLRPDGFTRGVRLRDV